MVLRPKALTGSGIGNAPVLTLDCGSFTFQGWSRAGVQTYWRVPEWRLGLDQGAAPWEFATSNVLALTHFHADHAGGLIAFLSTRNMTSQPAPVIVFPGIYEAPLKAFLAAWTALSGDILHCDLKPVAAGDELAIGPRRILRAFASVHVIPTLGYVVIERRGKLKAALAHESGAEIGARRRAGEETQDVLEVPLLAFCGDTTAQTLERNPFLYEVETLALESSFINDEPGPANAQKFGHVHINDLVQRADSFKNKRLILTHFSLRHGEREIVAELARRLPKTLQERVEIVAWV